MSATERSRVLFVGASPAIDRTVLARGVRAGARVRAERTVVVAGGKVLNAARAARALGADVSVVFTAGGHSGAWACAELRRVGIDAALVDIGAEMRVCTNIVDLDGAVVTEILEESPTVTGEAWTEVVIAVRRIVSRGGVRVVAVSGSLAPGAPREAFAAVVDEAHAAGAIAIVDTYGPPLRAALAAAPDVAKVNLSEAAELVVGDRDTASADGAAIALLDAGARAAIVTLGAEGAVIAEARDVRAVRAHAVDGRFTVGSGDAFLGALASQLALGSPLGVAVRWGMAAGAANALLPGPGVLDRAVVEQLAGTGA